MTDEREVYRGRLHWWWLVRPFGFVAIGLVIGLMGAVAMQSPPGTPAGAADAGQTLAVSCFCLPGGTLVALGLVLWVLVLLAMRRWQLVVTDRRITCRWGLLSNNVREILLAQLESVEVHQSLLGRMLGYGSVVFCGSGATRIPMRYVCEPERVRESVHTVQRPRW